MYTHITTMKDKRARSAEPARGEGASRPRFGGQRIQDISIVVAFCKACLVCLFVVPRQLHGK